MKRYVLAALLLASPAWSDERMIPYIEWLTENSQYEYHGEELPTIVQMPYAWLQVEVFGPETVARSEQQGYELPHIKGGYDPERNIMLFADDVDPWDWSKRDTMVHELVHFLQMTNGTMTECPGLSEREAYKLHWQWVEDNGHEDDFEEPNWLFVYMLEMGCYDHYR